MEAVLVTVVLNLVSIAIALVVAYFVIRAAVISALRHARREQYMENHLPEKAVWLSQRQRAELRAHAEASSQG